MEEEMRPEYDLKTLRTRRSGPERKANAGMVITLEPDVAAAFPDSATVNAALRFLLKMTRENPVATPPVPAP